MSLRKEAVRAVVTTNVTLSGIPASGDSDDITLVADDRVLLIAQTDPIENGFWKVATPGAWSRPTDFPTTEEVDTRTLTFVEEGTLYKDAGFVLLTPGDAFGKISVDGDEQEWSCFSQNGLPPGWLNVRDFGAKGDNTTDDSPAFAAAMEGFPGDYRSGAETEVDGTLWVPPGTYLMKDNFWLCRAVRVLGASGFGEFGSRLFFEKYKGIYVVGVDNSPVPQDGQGAIIESLFIRGGHSPVTDAFYNHDVWVADTDYEKGDRIVEAGERSWDPESPRRFQSMDRYFECISDGKSGLTEPEWEMTDNGIFDLTTISEWAPNTKYNHNSFVYVPNKFDVVFRPHDTGGYTIYDALSGTDRTELDGAIADGTAFDGNITWKAYDALHYFRGDTIDDPTEAAAEDPPQPVWVARRNAGIRVLRRCKIIDCQIANFLNAGIDLAASNFAPLQSWSIGTQVINVQIRQCGGGIHVHSTDSGASLFQAVDIRGSVDLIGYVDPPVDGTREFGIYDRSQFGNTYIGTQIADVIGPHIFQNGGNSTFVNCYTEGNSGTGIFEGGNAMIIGGLVPMTATSSVQGIVAPNDWRGVGSHLKFPDSNGADNSVVLSDTSLGSLVLSGNDGTGSFGWIYNKANVRGTWSLIGDNNPDKAVLRVNTIRAQNSSPYLMSIPRGYFVGLDDAHEMLFTWGGYSEYDVNIRGGQRRVGDRNIDKTLIKPNTFLESVVIEDGYRGLPGWQAPARTFGRAITFLGNDDCIEVNGYVYRCVNTGALGGTEPTWPTTPCPYPNIQVWNGPYNSSTGRAAYKVGDYVRPTEFNGFVYQCVAASTGVSGVEEGNIHPTNEPDWPLVVNDECFDGQLTWKCAGEDDEDYYVTEDAVGPATWVCVGKVPTYGKANFIHHQGTATLSTDADPVTGVIDLGPLPNDQINVYRVTVRAQNITEQKYAYWELSATWDEAGNELEAPSVDTSFLSTNIAADWSAALDIQDGRVVVNISQDGDQIVTFTAIRAIF